MSKEISYWGPRGRIATARLRYLTAWQEPDVSSASIDLSFELFGAATLAHAEAVERLSRLRLVLAAIWFFRSLWLGRSALRYADEALNSREWLSYSRTLSQVDRVLAVLYRFGWLDFGREEDAHRMLDLADSLLLAKAPCEPHTHAFLMAHFMNFNRLRRTEKNIAEMESIARMAEKNRKYEHALRIWEQVIIQRRKRFGPSSPKAKEALNEALKLAKEHSRNQFMRLQAI
jgi:hypothetical protein